MEIKQLEQFNPWWKTREMNKEWTKLYKRTLYYSLEKYLIQRQILLIQGLRRMGKTTLLFQLIENLLQKTEPKKIFYFSFDEHVVDIKEVLETYQKLVLAATFDALKEDKVYVFLDEIQKVENWENKLKTYYDLYPQIKFFISGSASVRLLRKSKESLAGRIYDFTLEPLSFKEFLEINNKNIAKIKENPELWKRELLPLFYKYLKFGTFPELATEENEEIARKYIMNTVVDRIIYKDIIEEFNVKDIELMKNIFSILCRNPGMLVNFREIANNLGRDQRTIANYFEYLEISLLTQSVYNYRGSPLASLRKLKKVYFSTPNIIFAYNSDIQDLLGYMLENLVLMHTKAKFFYKERYEVDFILLEGDSIIGIEVKSNAVRYNQLLNFQKKFRKKVKKMIIIDLENEGKEKEIEIVAAWKMLLE